MVEVNKPLVILAILAAGRVLFGLSDIDISIADTGTPNNEVIGNSSASITITMYTGDGE